MTLRRESAIADTSYMNSPTDVPQKQQRIVVVEDDFTIARLLEMCLEGPRRQIDCREDGAAGLEAIRDVEPDIVILDIALPVIDGWQVLRTLRSDHDNDVAVVVVTAVVGPDTRERAELAGADAYIAKPFHPNALREVVDGLVGAV